MDSINIEDNVGNVGNVSNVGNADNESKIIPPQIWNTLETPKYFSINRMFNNLPIRIIGSSQRPIFYLHEICDVLKLGTNKHINRFVNHVLEPEHYVSIQELESNDLDVYDINGRPNSNIVMINEDGVYVLLYRSNTQIGHSFRRFVNDLLKEIRNKEIEQLKVINEKLMVETGKHKAFITRLRNEQLSLENFVDKIYVFQIGIDATLIDDYKSFHAEDRIRSEDPNWTWVDDSVNTVTNYRDFVRDFPQLAIEMSFCYKLTDNPSKLDILTYRHRYTLFCRDSKEMLKKLDAKLHQYKTAKYNQHIFRCVWEVLETLLESNVQRHDSDYKPLNGANAQILAEKNAEVPLSQKDFCGFDHFDQFNE